MGSTPGISDKQGKSLDLECVTTIITFDWICCMEWIRFFDKMVVIYYAFYVNI